MIKPFSLLVVGAFFFGCVSCSKHEKVSPTLMVPICLATQSICKIKTQFGELSVLFNQEKITPENEFSIFVGNDTLNKDFKVTGFMEGKSMYMGKIPLFFSNDRQGKYNVANTLLGSCSDKQMVWTLQLAITSNLEASQGKIEHFSIEFTSVRE